jgi:citrate lyase subunit beta/citryl-CoA lyase
LEQARAATAEWLRTDPPGPVWVRINGGDEGVRDARAVVARGLAGVCVVGAESATELAALAVALAEAEEKVGLPIGTVRVIPVLVSAAAVLNAPHLARAPRVLRLQLGEADLCTELGAEPGPEGLELLWARSQVVAASAAAGIDPPIGAAYPEIDDLDALRTSTLALRRLGFRGRACLHPAQLPVVHEVFALRAQPAPAA